jgi:tetratricopeptide (TPR) repeat protein
VAEIAGNTKPSAPNDVSARIADFIQRHRVIFIAIPSAVVALVVIFIVVLVVRSNITRGNMVTLDELSTEYTTLTDSKGDNPSTDWLKKADALTEKLTAFGTHALNTYAGSRCYLLAASLAADQKKWPDMEKYCVAAGKKAKGTFLEAPAWYNAAVACEAQGKTDEAIKYYESTATIKDFAQGARAQFMLGRLQEKKGNKDAAKKAYQAVIDNWSSYSEWTNLAHTRLLQLELGD